MSWLAGCATRPSVALPTYSRNAVEAETQVSAGAAVAQFARAQIGQPYRFGGSSPAGFDCSGLALFVHAQTGIDLPRTAALQFSKARRVPQDELQPGDLVFYRMASRRVDHVGVYIGRGEFVHAPRPGSTVTVGAVQDPWFREHFAGAARYWADPECAKSKALHVM